MLRTNFGETSGILVDVCPLHGTWFDTGELRQAIAFAHATDFDPLRETDSTSLTPGSSADAAAVATPQQRPVKDARLLSAGPLRDLLELIECLRALLELVE